MPRYFYHIREGADLIEDTEGVDLPDVSAAREEAPVSLRPSTAPLIAGALAIVLIIFGVVGVVRKLQEGPAPDVRAEVTVGDGESRDVPLRMGTSDLKLKVERKGSNFVITSTGK